MAARIVQNNDRIDRCDAQVIRSREAATTTFVFRELGPTGGKHSGVRASAPVGSSVMLQVPKKIRAVSRDTNFRVGLDKSERVEIIQEALSKPTTISKGTPIMLNFTGYDSRLAAKGEEKNHIVGIGGSDNPTRLIEVLQRLELCSYELGVPLKKIAAAGGELKEFIKIEVHQLDKALRKTDASIEQKMALKSQMNRLGLLTVTR
jgi:hypothetical protein